MRRLVALISIAIASAACRRAPPPAPVPPVASAAQDEPEAPRKRAFRDAAVYVIFVVACICRYGWLVVHAIRGAPAPLSDPARLGD